MASEPVQQLVTTACLTVFFPLLRWVLNGYAFEPLAYQLLQPVWQQSDSKVTPERMHTAVQKFSESLWKLLVYSTFLAIGVVCAWRAPWVLDTWQFWQGWPHHEFTLPMRLLYNLELGFYVSSIFMIQCWEVRRKDHWPMFCHHIATATLIATSLRFSFWRIGTVVMLLHDANDVLMEAAKLAKYCKKEDLSLGLFASFVVAWLGLRLLAFPLMVIRSTLYELPSILGGKTNSYYMFNGLLLMLLVLHCYWFTLILRVVWVTLTTGQTQDVREDDD
ncbi:hypothetical protein OEZ86_005577 [Tetradesmus obliquus]|nr:hypothetical protein OEZ86_005577 [Tetradesmus obliquus]